MNARGRWFTPSRAALLGAALGILLLGVGAWAGMPAADHDASYFAGTALSAAHGDGLVNRTDPLLASQDPLGIGRFIAYPIGFPALLGAMGARSIRALYLVMWGLASIVLLAQGARLARAADGGGWLTALLVIAAGPALATLFANGAFRPEVVSIMLVLLWAGLAEQPEDGARRDFLFGALTGAAGLVQAPMVAYGAMAWPLLASRRHDLRTFVVRGTFATLGAVSVFALGTWLNPYGASEYYAAFVAFSRKVLVQPPLESWRAYWVTGTRYPLFIAPFVLAAMALAPSGRRIVATWRLPWVGLLFAGLLGALVWANTWRTPTRWYEAAVFLVIVHQVIVRAVAKRAATSSRMRALGVAAVLAFSINAVGVSWRALQGARALQAGTDVRSAQRVLAAELAGVHGTIAAAPPAGLLVLVPTQVCPVHDDRDGLRIGCQSPVRLLVRFEGRGGASDRVLTDSSGGRWVPRCRFSGGAGMERGWGFAVWMRERSPGGNSAASATAEPRRCGTS